MAEQISFSLDVKAKQPRVLVFDLETLRSADEVGGWGNIHKMGMACGVVHDSVDNESTVYDEKDAAQLVEHLKRGDLVVGFNQIRFDYRVLTAYSPVDFSRLPSFDILLDLDRILGHRVKLNSVVAATLGDAKSADGMQSLQWVKEGKLDLVREYCKKDVEVTRRLFEHGVREGTVNYQNYGQSTPVKVNWVLDHLVGKAKKDGVAYSF